MILISYQDIQILVYIVCVVDAPGSTNDVPFLRNVGGETTNSIELRDASRRGSAAYEADNYWVVYLLSAFQKGYSDDYDPDTPDIGSPLGATDDHSNVSAIWLEQIRDLTKNLGAEAALSIEGQAVVHEIGHQLLEEGDTAHTEGTIMDNAPFTPEEEKFSDAHIASIRSQTTSPGTD